MAGLNKTRDKHKANERFFRGLLIFAILCFVVGLLAYAYMGSFIRLIGDDYCYAGIERHYGFFGGQVQSYFREVPYHGDRITLTLISFLISLLPPAVNGWIPFLTILLFCLANYFLARSIVRFSHKLFPRILLHLFLGCPGFLYLPAGSDRQAKFVFPFGDAAIICSNNSDVLTGRMVIAD